jgi:hypothetical protein
MSGAKEKCPKLSKEYLFSLYPDSDEICKKFTEPKIEKDLTLICRHIPLNVVPKIYRGITTRKIICSQSFRYNSMALESIGRSAYIY